MTSTAESAASEPRFGHGLVIGKFYPPHAGHHLLVDAAAERCDRVTVVVLGGSEESITIDERVGWLADVHRPQRHVTIVGEINNNPVDFDDPDVWSLHIAVIEAGVARATIARGGPPEGAAVDAVFSSEPYGVELGRRFGAEPIAVDISRQSQPISGTAVRGDVVANWPFLAPPVRAGLALRVVVLRARPTSGPTSGLAEALTEALVRRGGVWADTQVVRDPRTDHAAAKLAALSVHAARAGRPAPTPSDVLWTAGDDLDLAERQRAAEDIAARAGSPVVICDTDAFTIAARRRIAGGVPHPGVTAIGDSRRHDLYLLDEVISIDRSALAPRTQLLADELADSGRRWELLVGPPAARLADALRHVDDLIATSWRFVEPKN